MDDECVEFDCIDCGRHIIRYPWAATPQPATSAYRCKECTVLPGWFMQPRLAAILDPSFVVGERAKATTGNGRR